MPFIFYDTETTGTVAGFDQILQFAAVKTDDDLNPIDTLDIRSRLLPYVLPSPGALLVTNVTIESVTNCPLSHFEMMRQVRARLLEWSAGGAIFAGWNSLRFDEVFLRQGYYQSLLPVYQTQTDGNGRMDIMRMVQIATAIAPNSVTVPLHEDGKPVFKLGRVADASGVILDNAHDALADTNAALALARQLKERVPRLWHTLVSNARKANVVDLVVENPVLLLSGATGRQPYNFVVAPISANQNNSSQWAVFDLQHDPADYLNADDATLIASIMGTEKVIRRAFVNAQPGLLPLEFAPDNVQGGRLPVEVYNERAQLVRTNWGFRERISKVLAGLYADQPTKQHVEQRIYDGFPSRQDESRMSQFHGVDWAERIAIISRLEDDRFRTLGQRILAVERPELLSDTQRARYAQWRRDRLFAGQDAPWLTLSKARETVAKLKEDGDADRTAFLTAYEQHLDTVERSLKAQDDLVYGALGGALGAIQLPPIDEEVSAGFSIEKFKQAHDDLRQRGSILYGTLRALCRRYPTHSDLNAVTAKVWIIGRSYATQIERHVPSDGTQGSALSKVAEFLHGRHIEIDAIISAIRFADDKDPQLLDDEDLPSCIRSHGKFAALLKEVTGGQSPRSFVSKYLHFHRPIVPIYDSVAAESLQKVVPWKKTYDCPPLGEAEDVYYRQYVMQLRQLNGAARRSGISPKVMALDWYLLHVAG
jgi:exodeoxyribonuclease-1